MLHGLWRTVAPVTTASVEEALRLLEPRHPPGIWPHLPHPTQQAFLLLDDDKEAFYGGAAGGGKSDALLMAVSQYIDVPHYRALILRRTYPELSMPGAIMDRAKQWWGGRAATWNGDEHTMTFPSGARIVFAHAQYETDVLRFAGTEFHAIMFDELTRFTEWMYRFLFSRLRKNEGDPIPLRMRGASNPGDVGHEWVKAWFVEPGAANRPFVPARLHDNPSIDQAAYTENLDDVAPDRPEAAVGRRLGRGGGRGVLPAGLVPHPRGATQAAGQGRPLLGLRRDATGRQERPGLDSRYQGGHRPRPHRVRARNDPVPGVLRHGGAARRPDGHARRAGGA